MNEEKAGLNSDITAKINYLLFMIQKPALHIANYFYEIRNNIDYDAERLIYYYRETNQYAHFVEISERRTAFIRILESLEKLIIANLDKTLNSFKEIGFYSLRKKATNFLAQSGEINDIEEVYVQLALDIYKATTKIEKRLIGEQTIVFIESKKMHTFGSLIHIQDAYLPENEIICLKNLHRDLYNTDDSIQKIGEEISKSTNSLLIVGGGRSFEITENLMIIFGLSKFLASKDFQDSAYHSMSKLRIPGISDDRRDDRNELTLIESQLRNFDSRLGPLFERLHLLDVRYCELEAFRVDLLAKCVELKTLRLLHVCQSSTRFNLSFLRSLSKLQMLEITLPEGPVDLAAFNELKSLRKLSIESPSSMDANKQRQVLSRNDLKCLSNVNLRELSISFFDIESIDKELLSGFSQLRKLAFMNNRIEHIDQAAFIDSLSSLSGISMINNQAKAFPDIFFASKLGISWLNIEQTRLYTLNDHWFVGQNKLTILTMVSCHIRYLAPGVFDGLVNLTNLDLTRNCIEKIKAGVFDKLTALTFLDLKHNPIEEIEPNAFLKLEKLTVLVLLRCKLTSITNQMFTGLRSLRSLDLAFNQIRSIQIINEEARVELITANLSSDEFAMVKQHLFCDLGGLLELFIRGNKLEKLDLNAFFNLKELSVLDLSQNLINELNSQASPDTLSVLTQLDLHDNQLIIFPQNAISNSNQLTTLDLSSNKLTGLADEIFAPFGHLKRLDLRFNELSINITRNTFANQCDSLIEINMLENKMIKVQDGAFENLACLRELYIDLPASFKGFSSRGQDDSFTRSSNSQDDVMQRDQDQSTTLVLNNSEPETLQIFLSNSENTEFMAFATAIGLVNSSLVSLEPLFLGKRFPNLRVLNLSQNQLGAIEPKWFADLGTLKALDLSDNLIELLEDPALFSCLLKLQELDLSGNILRRVHRRLFSGLCDLVSLNLGRNKHFSAIDPGLLRGLVSLRQLNLSGNNIAYLDLPPLLNSCRSLKTLELSDNLLDNKTFHRDALGQNSLLKELNIRNNRIESMEFARSLKSLVRLDLGDNMLESLESERDGNLLGRLVWLQYLDLSGNRLRKINNGTLAHLAYKLVHLDISNNPFG